MATQAYFSATGETLGTALEGARHSVHILLTGLCERSLFEHLLSCRRRGVQVELALRNGPINRQSPLAWERLSAAGGVVHWLQPELFMGWPHSLCLLDATHVISGTWQWGTRHGQQNCIVAETDIQWLEQYQALFAACRRQADSTSKPLQPGLEPLGTELCVNADTSPSAGNSAWQWHIWQLHALAWEAELAETRRQMALFDAQQDHRIGELLRSYLDLKRCYLDHLYLARGDETAKREAYTAKEDYDRYQQGRAEQATDFSENAGSPDPQQQAEIKQLYRKLAMLCHPDRVLDAYKGQARAVFQQVRQSYQRSDLAQLQQLYMLLQTQNTFEPRENVCAEQASFAQGRNALLMALQNAIAQQQQERNTLMQSATWRTLSSQPNWPVWFDQQAEHLQNEIQRYNDALGLNQPGATNRVDMSSCSNQCA